MNKGINIHFYHSPFEHESRIFKSTQTIASLNCFEKIMMLGVHHHTLPNIQIMDENRSIHRIYVRSRRLSGSFGKIVSQIEWQFKLFLKILFLKNVCVMNAHSLSVLPIGVLLKRIKKNILIYDAHELETETLNSTGLRKKIAQWLEKHLINSVDQVITVSDSIGAWYRETYLLKQVYVVKNIPFYKEDLDVVPRDVKAELKIKHHEILFIYQGMISHGRGIEEILHLFAAVKNKHILFIGDGNAVKNIKHYQQKHLNIHYLPMMPLNTLTAYTMGADIGIHLIEPNCLNHAYCLPNKLFEYMNAGIAVLVRNLPEMAAIIQKQDCGWLAPDNYHDMVAFLEQLTLEEIRIKCENAKGCRGYYRWQNEEKHLIQLYSNL